MPLTFPVLKKVRLLKTSMCASALLLALSTASLVFAQEKIQEKAQEKTEVEPIATDRPDFVESAQVVGKGRFQYEMGLSCNRSHLDGIKNRTCVTPTLLRFGGGEKWEFRIETDGFMRSTTHIPGLVSQTENGFGDTSFGVKWQMQDSDEAQGKPAIAWLFHADTDSGSAAFRGKGIRPSARMVAEWELPGDVSLGLMPGFVLDKDENGKRFTSGILAVTISRPLAEGWRGFLEVAGQQITSKEHGGNVITLDAGVSYLISNDVQIDFSISKGLTKAAPSFTAGLGFAIRY